MLETIPTLLFQVTVILEKLPLIDRIPPTSWDYILALADYRSVSFYHSQQLQRQIFNNWMVGVFFMFFNIFIIQPSI